MRHTRGLQQLAGALQPHNCSSFSGALQQLLPVSCHAPLLSKTRTFGSSSSSTGDSSQSDGAGAIAVLAAGGAAAAAALCLNQHPQDPDTHHAQQQLPAVQQQQQQGQLHLLARSLRHHFVAAADAPQQRPPPPQQQQQQQPAAGWSSPGLQPGSGGEPLSGAIAALDEQGLTNHPLDYNPITNEHTAAMTLAKQAGLEAYQAGRYAEAERRFKEAIEEARLGFPPNDPHIPSALHYLAEFYRNMGRLDEAEPLYRQTLSQLGDYLGERHWMYSAALCSLAALHEARGEYEQAIELLESALELRRQLFSNSSFLYADTAALLAKTLIAQHQAAAGAAVAAGSSSSSGGSSGWFGRGGGSSSSAGGKGGSSPPDVVRAIQLWATAVKIVEDSGSVVATPVVPWLLDMAVAQQSIGQHSAAVVSLQKALEYMALPQQQEQQGDGSGTAQQQQQQQPAQQVGSNVPPSSSDVPAADQDTLTAVMAASGGNPVLARLKLSAMASEVAERLVDAQLAAGDLQGARHTLRQALEARIALLGRHLVVAKTMTRLANLLMQAPVDPAAPQLAPHFASSAVAIADSALQNAQRTGLWRGVVRGALKAVQTASIGGYKAGLEAERTSDRLMAAIQLGNASLAVAAAAKLNSNLPEAEAALRHAVSELRWVLGVSAADTERLGSSKVEAALLQRVGGMTVDLKLLQIDCLEALAANLQEQAAAGKAPAASGKKKPKLTADGTPAEVAVLLADADRLAAEILAD